MKLTLLMLAGLALFTGTATQAVRADVPLAPFYDAVAKMQPDGKLGQVVKAEKIETAVPGAQAWRIAYVSSDVGDRKTLATALVMAPLGAAPAGGRPILAWSHGTTGAAENCGPSQITDPARSLNEYFLIGGDSWTDYGMPSVEHFIQDGYVVVGTDYQGLGGGGRHEYAVSVTNGRDVINSVRAVASMPELEAGKKAVVYGWSQGGGSTLGAAGQGAYIAQTGTAADGIEFLGFVAMAPDDVTAGMPAITNEASAQKALATLEGTFGGNVFNFAHFATFVWGTQAAFPNLHLSDVFTADGAMAIDRIIANKCVHAAADTLNYTYGDTFKSLLQPQANGALAWFDAFAKGGVPPTAPVAPVIIFWGTADTVVPPVMGQIYRQQMCKLGANVTRVQLPGAQTHFSTPGASAPYYIPWIEDRFAGKPVPNGCAGG